MSTFSGSQSKGAMRRHREILRDEAAERQADYDQTVRELADELGIRDLDEARLVMRTDLREDYQTNAEIEQAFLDGEPLRCATFGGAA